MKATTNYAASVVKPAKLSLGVPAYGYDWDTTAGAGVAVFWNQIPALIAAQHATPVLDNATSSPHFSYVSAGDRHVVWYENPKSITLKAEFATGKALEGVSVFALGYVNSSFWAALKAGGQ